MTLIKPILILGIASSFLLYLRFFRTQLRDRLIASLLLAGAIGIVLFPDYTTVVAHGLGVTRGTDLMLYLFIVLAFFAGLLMYSRIVELEHRQTKLIRHLAILGAEAPNQPRA